jgi:hypothetical protein
MDRVQCHPSRLGRRARSRLDPARGSCFPSNCITFAVMPDRPIALSTPVACETSSLVVWVSAILDDDIGGLDFRGAAYSTEPYLTATLQYSDRMSDRREDLTLPHGTHTCIPRIGYFCRSPDRQIVMPLFVTMEATFTLR